MTLSKRYRWDIQEASPFHPVNHLFMIHDIEPGLQHLIAAHPVLSPGRQAALRTYRAPGRDALPDEWPSVEGRW